MGLLNVGLEVYSKIVVSNHIIVKASKHAALSLAWLICGAKEDIPICNKVLFSAELLFSVSHVTITASCEGPPYKGESIFSSCYRF